jgi:hypothetical protein
MTTLKFTPYIDFDELSVEEATKVLYDVLLPQCEKKKIYLSQYGNIGLCVDKERYEEKKAEKTCFDVKRVQEVFAWAQTGLQPRSTYKSGSYGLKHLVEELPGHRYTTNGDLIAALLLLGHSARFGRIDGPNCQFKLVIKKGF